MKSLWSYAFILIGLSAGIAMVACSKSSSNGGISCPVGTVLTPDGASCINATVVPTGVPNGTKIGFYTQTSNVQSYNSGGSVMTLGTGFKTMLKDLMGVCDRQNQIGGSNYGLSACDSWLSGYHDMVIQMDGSSANQVKLVLRSSPSYNQNYWYNASVPSFSQFIGGLLGFSFGNNAGYYDPLVLNMTIWNINNSQGFELRANGPTVSYGWSKLVQLQVLNGKIEDPTLNFTLYVDGGNQQMLTAVSGTMVRCQTQNCGVTGL